MKLYWAQDHKSIILVAETEGDIVIGELLVEGSTSHQYVKTMKGNAMVGTKWAIIPDEPPEAGKEKS